MLFKLLFSETQTASSGDSSSGGDSGMIHWFLLGQFLNGAGCTPLSVLGVTFIDESVDPKVYPIYIGKITRMFSYNAGESFSQSAKKRGPGQPLP